MGKKVRKLKSSNRLWVSEEERYLVTANSRNTVYLYDLECGSTKPIFSVKTVSNVSNYALSPDATLLAAKNTSGEIALIRVEDGEELFRNKMERREGYQIFFTEDGKQVVDLDWDGRTMVLDTGSGNHVVADGPNIRGENGYPYVSFMNYDRFSKRIIKIVQRPDDFHDGAVLASPARPEEISYEVIRTIRDGYIPGSVDGISLCRGRNYYYERFDGVLVVTDKEFRELKRIPLPEDFRTYPSANIHIWASPCDRYLLYNYMNLSVLYEAETLKAVKAFDHDYVWSFTMIREDSVFFLGTWEGVFCGEI